MEAVKTTLKLEDVLDLLYARQYAYDMLRRIFIEEPSREYMQSFVRENMHKFFPFKENGTGIAEGIKEIEGYFHRHNPGKIEQHYQDLHWDYTRLFIGPFELPVYPWESAYVTKDKLLFQETTMAVRKWYKKYGFQTVETNVEADDHIGLELDFIYHLNELAIKSANSVTPTSVKEVVYLIHEQDQFISAHLGKFAAELANKVAEHADTGFYRGAALILRDFIQIDSNVLKELLNIEIVTN